MSYSAQKFDTLLGTPGFSDALLTNHFTLYGGYVKNTNTLLSELSDMRAQNKMGTPAFAELKRRFGWEFNGMRFHELYFENMKRQGQPLTAGSLLAKKLENDFGSVDQWKNEFVATASLRGIGWVVLMNDPLGKRLLNVWVNEHDGGLLATGIPLLVLDVFEHAYTLDYGLKKADYVNAFFNAADWSVVEKRFHSSH